MRLGVMVLSLGLAGCAATGRPHVPMPEPPRVVAGPLGTPEFSRSVAPSVDLPTLMASELILPVSHAEAKAAVALANQQAVVRPRRAWFQGSTLTYPYQRGSIYTILTKDQSPTSLLFDAPERVIKVHFADDDWFDIVLMERETIHQPDAVVIIPKAPKLKKDISILTTAHLYSLALESSETQGLVQVQWAHPVTVVAPKPLLPEGLYYAGLEILPVYGSPPWTPLAAWAIPAVGKTLIQFPPAMKRFGMPIVKAMGADGETKETMNWRVKGDYLEVDRFFTEAEVRFGHEDVAVVRIAQTAAMTAVYCPQSPACPNPELAR